MLLKTQKIGKIKCSWNTNLPGTDEQNSALKKIKNVSWMHKIIQNNKRRRWSWETIVFTLFHLSIRTFGSLAPTIANVNWWSCTTSSVVTKMKSSENWAWTWQSMAASDSFACTLLRWTLTNLFPWLPAKWGVNKLMNVSKIDEKVSKHRERDTGNENWPHELSVNWISAFHHR